MPDLIAALNVGSSSLKARVVAADAPDDLVLACLFDRIGTESGRLRVSRPGAPPMSEACNVPDAASALGRFAHLVEESVPDGRVTAVGHRVVHGGRDFTGPVRVDDVVLSRLDGLSALAPLHQPAAISGIRTAIEHFPKALQIACFDTAFHASKPWVQDIYALPAEFYDAGVRRYGFHGLSCQSVLRRLRRDDPVAAESNLVIAHLGSGASVTAVSRGVSQFCSMGFSTLDGLAMGTRPGHLDPGVILHFLRGGMSVDDLEELLYRRSGLLGLSGLSNDLRDLLNSDSEKARNAVEVFVARCVEEIARASAVIGGADLLIFCGGIGENATALTEEIAGRLAFLRRPDGGRLTARVVPTDEEAEIVAEVLTLV